MRGVEERASARSRLWAEVFEVIASSVVDVRRKVTGHLKSSLASLVYRLPLIAALLAVERASSARGTTAPLETIEQREHVVLGEDGFFVEGAVLEAKASGFRPGRLALSAAGRPAP
jgi:hypothetical protein